MAEAYMYFYENINELLREGYQMENLVANIVSSLDGDLTVIERKVRNDYDAYLLFETLNDRGLALSVDDLLKNYLFSRAGAERLEDVQENWESMVSSLHRHPVKTFLRHYWLSTQGVVRDKALYKEITTRFQKPEEVYKLSRNLKDSAELYGAFSDPENSWWDQFDPEDKRKIKKHIEQINIYGATQCYPLLLATLDAARKIFESVLRMLVIFTFRYSIIGGMGPRNLEKAFSNAAIFIRENPRSTASDVYRRISILYPDDSEFVSQFEEKQIKHSGLAKYILASVNDYLESNKERVTNTDPSELNLEHVLPKKFSPEWAQCFGGEDVAKDYVYRLGNMTLLSMRINKNIANSDFKTKRDRAYRSSDIQITANIAEFERWGPREIQARQKNLAKTAAEVWRVDF